MSERRACSVVGELVERLDLQDAVVMGQDWGGPIGMDVASRLPDRFSGLVMGNTWFWPADDNTTRGFSLAMGSPPMQALIKRRNFFVTTLMKRMLLPEAGHYIQEDAPEAIVQAIIERFAA